MINIKQFFEPVTSTYTYIVYDSISREAAIIDSVLNYTNEYMNFIKKENLYLKFILETHIHADHITDATNLKEKTFAKIGLSENANTSCQNLKLKNNDLLMIGDFKLIILETFGHTNTCISFKIDKYLFTGDSLLINGSGRTDFQAGSPEQLFKSIQKIYSELPEETIVYPAHDYNGLFSTTIKEQKENNSRINKNTTLEEFVNTMNNLNLPKPKYIKKSLPSNYNCGNL